MSLPKILIGVALLATAACNSNEGTGRTSEDGRGEIAETGVFNGSVTHGEGVGTVQDKADPAESGIYPDDGNSGSGMPQSSNSASAKPTN